MKKWNLSVSDLGSWGVDALIVTTLAMISVSYFRKERLMNPLCSNCVCRLVHRFFPLVLTTVTISCTFTYDNNCLLRI
jgi:hypothetical protein